MKVIFFILVITAITINSTPFLRVLDASTTVTKDSCEKSGKSYTEAIPATCKKNNNMYNVTDEAQCEAGTWGKKCSASAAKVITQTNCTGKPVFTAKASSSCKIKDKGKLVESGEDEDSCKEKVKWTPECSESKVTDMTKCEGTGSWSKGTCTITDTSVTLGDMSQDACGKLTVSWDDTATKCKVSSFTCPTGGDANTFTQSGSDCLISNTVIIADNKDNQCKSTTFEGAAKGNDVKCYVAGNVEVEAENADKCKEITLTKKGSCSQTEITKEEECQYTYTPAVEANKCTLSVTVDGKSDTIELTDEERLKNQTKCETTLEWVDSAGCNSAVGKDETDCKVPGEYTKGTDAQCVAKSGATKLSGISLLLILIISSLF